MAIRIRERHAVISSDMVSSLTMGVEWTNSRDSMDNTSTGSTSVRPSTYLLPTMALAV